MKMILADKIVNERKKNGWSQEELAEKLGVSRQSISKWEGAQAVPDLQKILNMAEIFGVSTDYLLKDEISASCEESVALVEKSDSVPPLRKVSMEEANEFLDIKKWEAPRAAIGTAMCITSPVVLIFLAGMSEISNISENLVAGIGTIWLLVQIALAVYLFINIDNKTKKFAEFEKIDIETAYGVSGMVKERRAAFEKKENQYVAIGVILCILCSVPLLVAAFMEAADVVIISMVCVLLLTVAFAVNLFIRVGTVSDSYKILLEEDDYTPAAKKNAKRVKPFIRVYWLLAVAVYLGISFYTNAWHRTWIVWPVAAVGFVVYKSLLNIFLKIEE